MFVLVQDTFGLPFLPYLGRFAIICATEPSVASSSELPLLLPQTTLVL